ncbi:unnamed protein product [Adineta steineri]|uniref:Uncharacterized protein n=1 Tax=Adineta steineri TaxID=433720 RepID=A0A816EEL1_9BILA|nr:unnamed protein product [Adineta steineri]CAF1648739.1 unnamed protein product [Adineta steineri]
MKNRSLGLDLGVVEDAIILSNAHPQPHPCNSRPSEGLIPAPPSTEPLSTNVITAILIIISNINIHEDTTSSSISDPSVVYIQNSIDLHLNYDQPCSSNSIDNRYFICKNNFTWACLPNTYHKSIKSMCSTQLSVPLYPL